MALPGSPTLRQGFVSSTTNSASWDAFSNVAVPSGSLAVFFVTIDQIPTVSVGGSDTNWFQLYNSVRTNAVRGACFYWFNDTGGTVNKSFTLTAASTQQYSGILYIIPRTTEGTWLRLSATIANNEAANPNPPNHNAGAVRDHLWIAPVHSKNLGVATAAPAGYGHLTTQNAGGAAGVSTYSAELAQLATQQEDPSEFTQSISRPFVVATVAIWEYDPVTAALASGVTGSVSLNGAVSKSVPVDGSISGTASVSAGLAKTATLAGTVDVGAVALATFDGSSSFAGSADAAATVSGTLGVAKALAGALTATSTASGAASKGATLRSDTTIAATGLASIALTKPLASIALTSVTVSADLLGEVVAGDLVLSYTVLGIEAHVSAPELVAAVKAEAVEATVIGRTVQAA